MKLLHFAIPVLFLTITAACKSKNTQTETTVSQQPIKEVVTFNADSAYSFVKQQVDFGPRVPGTPGHKACSDYIARKLKSYGADSIILQPAIVTNYLGDKLPIVNIMGRYNPDAGRRVLLLAHWDTRPWADSDPNIENRARPILGANDGASGVGVMLEIARLMQQKRPDIGVDLLFVDGEDCGMSEGWGSSESSWCLGTQYWTEHMPYEADQLPDYGILLDMVGGRDALFYKEYVSEQNASQVNSRIWQIAEASGYGDRFPKEVRGGITDDHIFINRAGIPCIDIIECGNPVTGTFPEHWHTLDDDMKIIDKGSLKAAGQTVVNALYIEKDNKKQ